MRLLPLQSSRPGDFNCNTCNTKTPGSSPCQLMLVMVSSVASDIFEWNNNHTRIRTVSFIHVLKSIHLLVFFFFLCQSTQHLYISPKNRLKERCPKECVYKLPINTLTHALMHAHTRTPTVYIPPLVSSLQAIPSVSVGHAPSSQPRRGTFGSSFSGKNRQNKTKMLDVIFCHRLFFSVS